MNKLYTITTFCAALFLFACGENKEADKNANTSVVQPLVFEGYQNDAGDILYIANIPEENIIHLKVGSEEFIINKKVDSEGNLSNGELTLIQNDGRTVLKRNNQILFEQNPRIISGKLNLGNNENAIIDCATGNSYWINDKTGTLKETYDKLTGNEGRAYDPIFVEVKTVDRGKTNEGPSASFNGVYDIIEVISSREATDSDCIK